MVLSDEKKKEYVKRILMSRMRLLINNGFYGLLLMHMSYSIDETVKQQPQTGTGYSSDRNFWTISATRNLISL